MIWGPVSLLKFLYSLFFPVVLSILLLKLHWILLNLPFNCYFISQIFFSLCAFTYTDSGNLNNEHTMYSVNDCNQSGLSADWRKIICSKRSKKNKHAERIEKKIVCICTQIFPYTSCLPDKLLCLYMRKSTWVGVRNPTIVSRKNRKVVVSVWGYLLGVILEVFSAE